MRIKVIDSHRNRNNKSIEELVSFFQEVKNLDADGAHEQTNFCDWYEREFAVKWFEIVALDGSKVAGYLRLLRNPEILTEWFIGDVHVRENYKHQGVASKMYEKAIDIVKEFEAAEYIVTSVHRDNYKSIGLHEKLGFRDTKKPCEFPNFYFDEKESEYKRWIYNYYPVPNVDMAMEQILPLWKDYQKNDLHSEKKFCKILKEVFEEGKYDFESIWCGNRLVGFTYYNNESEVYYNKQNNDDICGD